MWFSSVPLQALILAASAYAVDPAAVYDGGHKSSSTPITLRIGNGGAGQSGLIGGRFIPLHYHDGHSANFISALADAFIQSSVKNGSSPFRVAWYTSDTTESINYLKSDTVDVGITYTPAAEQIAINQGIAKSPAWYAWRDHFMLVGPPSNPANLTKSDDIYLQFSKIYAGAEAGNTNPPVRFLTRYDKSATNIKDSQLWIQIGQVCLVRSAIPSKSSQLT